MSIHASARLSNVKRSLFAWLDAQVVALELPGAPALVLDGGERAPDGGPWIRAVVQPLGARRTGRADADHLASFREVLLVVDLFWPRDRDIYQVDEAAELLADALDLLSLPLNDYADPAAPVAIAGARLRNLDGVPIPLRVELEAEWDRRQIRAPIGWTARKAA
jgi:hypothetical protein